MSYEGYLQNICESGHRFDCPDDRFYCRKEPLCPFCQKRIVLCNPVDTTNFESLGFISDEDWERFLHTPAKTQVCNLGHTHVLEEPTYLIPNEEELKAMRTVIVGWEGEGDQAIPIRKPLNQPW